MPHGVLKHDRECGDSSHNIQEGPSLTGRVNARMWSCSYVANGLYQRGVPLVILGAKDKLSKGSTVQSLEDR